MLQGVVLSFITVVLWSLESVFSRYVIIEWGVQPFAYTSLSLFIGALALLVISGPGNLGISTIKSPHTWAFSVFDILTLLFFILSVQFITATESNLLNRGSIPLTVMATWLFLSRKPHPYDLPGLLLIIFGLWLVTLGLEAEVRMEALALCLLVGISQAARTLIAETHPTSSMAETIKDRCRTSGYVLYVASFVFLAALVLLAIAKEDISVNAATGIWLHVPSIADFFHTPTLLLASFFGVVLVSSMTYFYLYASRVAKSELLMIVVAFLPLVTFIVEYTASLAGFLDASAIRSTLLLPGAFIILGAVLMVYSRYRRHKTGEIERWESYLTYQAFNPQSVKESREILKTTLAHFSGDYERSSLALNLPAVALRTLANDNEQALAFKAKLLPEMMRRYRIHVSFSDALTGLWNRHAFMTMGEDRLQTGKACVLFYVDLDKFKPINDTYGHAAGDFALKWAANQIKSAVPPTAIVARLGGDEFAVLTKGKVNIENTFKKIKKALEKPLALPDAPEKITLGGSVGAAHYPTQGETLEDLMIFADKSMYKEKNIKK